MYFLLQGICMFSLNFFILFSLILSLQKLECNAYEKELDQRLEEVAPINEERAELEKEKEKFNNKAQELEQKTKNWSDKALPLIKDIIKDVRLDTQSKMNLIKKFFAATSLKPNDKFITIHHSQFYLDSYKVEKSYFSTLVSHILENDYRNCPVDMIQAFMEIGAEPGSESPVYEPVLLLSDFTKMNKNYREDAHCVVKEMLKNSKNDACKSCAQKIDDLFNHYKNSKK